MVIDKVLVLASAYIKNKQGKVLLVKRSDKSSYPGYWQLVEGKLESGESPLNAIKREVKEEIGAKIVHAEFSNIFFNEIKAKGLVYLCFRTVFSATISHKKLTISDEHSEIGWFDKKDALKLLLLLGTENIIRYS